MRLTPESRSEVEELTWRIIDNEIDEPNFRRLETYLTDSEEARHLYVECFWLHTALLHHYQPDRFKRLLPQMSPGNAFMEALEESEPLANQREVARQRRTKKPTPNN
ncbi:MAG: hypothetical protein GC162_18915 [Planctomycetes bacterium]|nr:hypothetical protein [Planctomycetota bacterium]